MSTKVVCTQPHYQERRVRVWSSLAGATLREAGGGYGPAVGGEVAGILGQTLLGRPAEAGQVGRPSAGGGRVAGPGKGSD